VSVLLPQSPRSKGFTEPTTDWLAVWALSVGVAAAFMAGVVYFTVGDRVGAALVLSGAAAIVGAALFGSGRPPVKRP
jgi:uncharacterized membrane protein (DUF441 family)